MMSIVSPNPWILSILRTITGLGVGDYCMTVRMMYTRADSLVPPYSGMCQTAKPIYVSELAPDQHRGRIMATFTLAYSLGLGSTKIAENILIDGEPEMTWRIFIIGGALPATFLLITIMVFVPESPVWLDEQKAGREERQRLAPSDPPAQDTEEAEEEEEASTAGAYQGAGEEGDGPGDVPWDSTWQFVINTELYNNPLRLSLLLIGAQQLVGISIIMLHTNDFIAAAGVSETGSQITLLSIFVALAHLLGAVAGLCITVYRLPFPSNSAASPLRASYRRGSDPPTPPMPLSLVSLV